MKNENGIYRRQLRGYIFEIVIMELLKKNDFAPIDLRNEPQDRINEPRKGFIEFKGRGCWHQIDCPCDYTKFIPFSYPLRLLGEVKFHKKPIEKKFIREYIGTIKDIQENYFVADSTTPLNIYPRRMEFGVIFSASGFQAEAEKLAYAHGIKTISYTNNFIIDRLKKLIDEFESNYLSINCLKENNWNEIKTILELLFTFGQSHTNIYTQRYFASGYMEFARYIYQELKDIKTSFIATTTTGVFIHFVSNSQFPAELFRQNDVGYCRVFYNYDDFGQRYFWLEISGDQQRRQFYFTPPESLDEAAVYGNEIALNEKERIFKKLSVNIMLDGVSRTLTLCLDTDWSKNIRNSYHR